MSGAASLAFPGGRTLAGWRRQLAAHAPECCWAGYLSFHRIDAPVLTESPHKIPPFELLVLKAAVTHQSQISISRLHDWLQLEPGLINSVLTFLTREGLLKVTENGAMATEAGRQAAAHGEYPKTRSERRSFYFWLGDWAEHPSSRFVNLSQPDQIPWLASPPIPFAPEQLVHCIQQTPAWKHEHGFPRGIKEALCQSAGSPPDDLDQVMVATPTRFFAVVARSRSIQGTVLLGFAVNVRTWEMHAAAPAFRMPEDPPVWFPPPLTKNAVRNAFGEWGRQRQFAVDESQRCDLRLEGDHLFVESSSWGLGRLRGSHGESWLLAGDGLIRAALQLDFV